MATAGVSIASGEVAVDATSRAAVDEGMRPIADGAQVRHTPIALILRLIPQWRMAVVNMAANISN